MISSRIIGTGGYLPEKILTNADLERQVDTSDEWIVQRTGIHERRIAAPHETSHSMATDAARKAIMAAGIDASEIDMVIVATATSDRIFPSVACEVHAELGLRDCPAFDVSAACAGFIYAFSIADQFIRTGAAKTILVIGSEVMSRAVDWTDRKTCILFGDGAGAVILQQSELRGVLSTHLHADGQYKELLSLMSYTGSTRAGEPAFIEMSGNEVFKIAVNYLDDIVMKTLQANQLTKADIDWLVPHQANLRIIAAMAKKLGMPMEQVVVTLDKQGNTSAASVPLALDAAIQDGRIQRGQTLLLESFGGGLTWGSALVIY